MIARYAWFVTSLAHLAASAVLVFLPTLYSKTHQGKEARPVLVPVLLIALVLEILFVSLALRRESGAPSLLKLSLAVLLSWIAGLASFLSLDILVGAVPLIPLVSWLFSLAVLLMLVNRLVRRTS